jgi:putative FmdB family regulatory protein
LALSNRECQITAVVRSPGSVREGSMPTYDYRCSECGHRFEQVQSFHDAPIRQCPVCERPDSVRKVYGNVGVVLKGSGFYRTDNRTSAGSSAGSTGKGSDSGSSDKGSSDRGSDSGSSPSSDTKSTDSGSKSSDSGSKSSDSGSKGSGSGSSGSSKAAASS